MEKLICKHRNWQTHYQNTSLGYCFYLHWKKAEAFMKTFGLQEDYRGHVKAYDADLIFTKHGKRCRCSGIHHSIIRRSDRVSTKVKAVSLMLLTL